MVKMATTEADANHDAETRGTISRIWLEHDQKLVQVAYRELQHTQNLDEMEARLREVRKQQREIGERQIARQVHEDAKRRQAAEETENDRAEQERYRQEELELEELMQKACQARLDNLQERKNVEEERIKVVDGWRMKMNKKNVEHTINIMNTGNGLLNTI